LPSREAASGSVSAAVSMIPRPSRSHCTPAPVTKMAASRAYTVRCPIPQAIVVSSPGGASGGAAPEFSSAKEPVPYVVLPWPGIQAGVAVERGLLVARDARDGDGVAVQRLGPGRPEVPDGGPDLGQRPLRDVPEEREQLGSQRPAEMS
jgi:hypothetical protein